MRGDPLDSLVQALRSAEPPDPALRTRIMDAIRREAGEAHPGSPTVRATRAASAAPDAAPDAGGRGAAPAPRFPTVRMRRLSRGPALQGLAGLALAAGVASVITLGADRPRVDASVRTVGTLDTVAATIRDTVRLVQFMLVAPTASRVAVAGDFNGWDPKATPLARATPRGSWSVALSLPHGRHRYAMVVDDTGWVEGEVDVAPRE